MLLVYLCTLVAVSLWGLSYIWCDRLINLTIPVEFFLPVRILLAGLISDTRNLKKSTTTALDALAMKDLAGKAGLTAAEIQTVSDRMVAASKDLSGMSDRDIFLADYKSYNIENIWLGIGNLDSKGDATEDAFLDRMLAVMPSTS